MEDRSGDRRVGTVDAMGVEDELVGMRLFGTVNQFFHGHLSTHSIR